MKSTYFDVRQTMVAKGIGCLLLLFHHLFYDSSVYLNKTNFSTIITFNGSPLANVLADSLKVCVAMFLVLSGYGLSGAISKKCKENNKIFVCALNTSIRIGLKLIISFMLIFLLFVPWQGAVGHNPYEGWQHVVIDSLGVSYLMGTPTMNPTWWYMSVALICYALTPLLFCFTKKLPVLSFATGFSILFVSGFTYKRFNVFMMLFYISIYYFGLLLYQFDVFNRIMLLSIKKPFYKYAVLPVVGIVYCWRYVHGFTVDFLFSIVLILFSAICLSCIPLVNNFLELLGKHSGNIFMMHTFLYLYNIKQLVYAPKYSPLIFIWFIFICLAISCIIELLKKLLRVDKLLLFINRIIDSLFYRISYSKVGG